MKIRNRIVTPTALLITIFFNGNTLLANTLDPVSPEEISRAMVLASPVTTPQSRGTPSKTELLSVRAHRFEKSEQNKGFRWADTLVYDYSTDELITTVIDLDSNEIISVQKNKGMQLPITKNELERALDIIFADDEEFSILKAEFNAITSETLTTKNQLNYKAFTFFADSMPNVVNSASKVCGTQRCAQLMFYTNDQVAFGSSPIVNLSAGLVSQRIGNQGGL